jgi:hypothetical protein
LLILVRYREGAQPVTGKRKFQHLKHKERKPQMSCLSELKALELSPAAKAAIATRGRDAESLLQLAQGTTRDLVKILQEIISSHPVGKPDAANLATLKRILSDLS